MPKALIRLALIGRAKGLKGEVHASLTGDDLSWLTGATELWVGPEGKKPVRYEIERAAAGGSKLVIKFKGVDDRDAAEAIKGFEILIDQDLLPELEGDRFWVHDAIGFRVVDKKRGDIGSLKSVLETGANDCFEILPVRGESFLVPVTEETFEGMDKESKSLRVNLLPGSVPGDPDED